MGTIVICAPALGGEIGMTRGIARGLQAAGHRVVYVGFPAIAPLVGAMGFECVPVFTDWPVRTASTRASSIHARWRAARARAARLDELLDSLLDGEGNTFLEALREIRPDLVLVSSCVFENLLWTVLSLGSSYRTAYLTNNFDRRASMDVPPVSSSRLPPASVVERTATWLTWQSCLITRDAAGRLRAALGLSANWRGRIEAFMRRFDLSRSLLDMHRVMPAFRLPELVPFPREFDFEAATPDTYHYAGPCVDVDPPHVPFDWTALDRRAEHPLIVVAFGNLHDAARQQRERLLRLVIEAARTCLPRATWVVAAGDSIASLLRQRPLPAHVILVDRIPQVQLLARAALMITHGGSNSVRECLHFGVPMLVFPRWFDQYGIAARVRVHGLGLVGDGSRTTSPAIARQVTQLLDDPTYAERAVVMRRAAQAYSQPDLAVRIIESWMGRPRQNWKISAGVRGTAPRGSID